MTVGTVVVFHMGLIIHHIFFKMDEQAVTIEAANKEAENVYRVKKKTFDLLPESEENLNKLMVLSNF